MPLSAEERAERSRTSLAAWDRIRAEGRAGWSPERHAKFMATVAQKRAERLAAGWKPAEHHRRYHGPSLGSRVTQLEAAVARLEAAIAELRDEQARELEEIRRSIVESRPKSVTVVEWRPDHRRQKDGGQPVRAQRRAVGVPRRPRGLTSTG